MKISASSKTEFKISRNVHFLCLCTDIEQFLINYKHAITNKSANREQTNYYYKHFDDIDIISICKDFTIWLNEIMIDEKGYKIKTRRQLKLSSRGIELVYKIFNFTYDLDSVNFQGTKLWDDYTHFQRRYKFNKFYNVPGIVEDFLKQYDMVNSKEIPHHS
jgi:hypothetical protein